MDIYFTGNRKVDVASGFFVIHTDQSIAHGGEATAPEPFTLFLASLGACAGFYVLKFCQTRNLSTDDIKLTQNAEFGPDGVLSKVTIDVHVPPDFPQKYLQAIQAAAGQCAVKKAIQAQPPIVVNTVQAREEARA